MSDESTNFWREVSNWMMTYYDEQKTHNNDSTKECWGLVIYCLKAIFHVIQKVRVLGTTRNLESMVWASMQAHKVCRELIALKFQGHPDVSVILHQHLIDNSVPFSHFDALRAEFETLRKPIKDVHDEAAAARSVADKALSTAIKKMTWLPVEGREALAREQMVERTGETLERDSVEESSKMALVYKQMVERTNQSVDVREGKRQRVMSVPEGVEAMAECQVRVGARAVWFGIVADGIFYWQWCVEAGGNLEWVWQVAGDTTAPGITMKVPVVSAKEKPLGTLLQEHPVVDAVFFDSLGPTPSHPVWGDCSLNLVVWHHGYRRCHPPRDSCWLEPPSDGN